MYTVYLSGTDSASDHEVRMMGRLLEALTRAGCLDGVTWADGRDENDNESIRINVNTTTGIEEFKKLCRTLGRTSYVQEN